MFAIAVPRYAQVFLSLFIFYCAASFNKVQQSAEIACEAPRQHSGGESKRDT